MLSNGVRFCDVCTTAIAVGERYESSIVPRERAEMFFTLISLANTAEEFSTDQDGSVRISICLECKMNLHLSSPLVN
jgi:hypothetical protein